MVFVFKKLFAICMVMAFLFTASCTRNVKETKLINENAKFSLIIAGDSSEYKDNIRDSLISKYKAEGSIEVINIENLESVAEDSYDVILIMDTCLAWGTFNQSVSKFLENTEKKDNIVLFITANDLEWEFSYQNVDAITSASEMEDKDAVTDTLAARIDSIISGL